MAVDCSGSINDRLLGLFEAEIRSILAGQQPRLVHVLYFDTEVQKVETYQAGQPIRLSPVGGGGTDFRPCFTWLNDRGISTTDVGLPNGPLGHIPRSGATLSGTLGVHGYPESTIRPSHSHGGGVRRLYGRLWTSSIVALVPCFFESQPPRRFNVQGGEE
jgi:VWA-like domain (DUF2201)